MFLGLLWRQKPDDGQRRAVCQVASRINPFTCSVTRCLQSLSDQAPSGTALLKSVYLLKAKLRGSLTGSSFPGMDCLVALRKVSRDAGCPFPSKPNVLVLVLALSIMQLAVVLPKACSETLDPQVEINNPSRIIPLTSTGLCHSMPDEPLHQEILESLERMGNHKFLILSE